MLVVVVLALVVAAAAAVIAAVLQRRTAPVPPTQPRQYAVPAQLDRDDFVSPEAPWLVAVFSSSTCRSCAGVREKALAMECAEVAVEDIDVGDRKDLHERYAIEAVPMLLVADAEGIVRVSFVGSPSAADLWAAVAELREPGSVPEGCDHHGSTPEL